MSLTVHLALVFHVFIAVVVMVMFVAVMVQAPLFSSYYWATGWRPSVVDWSGGISLMLHRGSNYPLSLAMDGGIMRHGIISSCQSAATSETVKHSWSWVYTCNVSIAIPRPVPFTFHYYFWLPFNRSIFSAVTLGKVGSPLRVCG